jgi:hypothetical protein
MTSGGDQCGFEFSIFGLGHPARSKLICELPQVRACTKPTSTVNSRLGWSSRDHDGWHVHTRRTHQRCWYRLITTSHEDDCIERIGPYTLLYIHCHEIAIQHGGWLHKRLTKGHRWELDWQPSSLQDTALNGLRKSSKVNVAVDQFGPTVADSNDRATSEGRLSDALGLQIRSVN